MEDEVKNLTSVWFSVITSLIYCYFVSSKIPKGVLRLITLTPIFYLFTVLPLYLSSAFFTAVTTFFITWLCNFKLLLFAFDRGPLSPTSSDPPKSLVVFIALASLPLRVKQNNVKEPKKLPLNFATVSLLCCVLIQLIVRYKDLINPRMLLVAYCFLIFLMVDALVEASSVVGRALIGLEVGPASDEPYLSGSLGEFWGRRWNLTVTNTLRVTIYDPIRKIRSGQIGDEWARMLAVVAAFVVSGLMHELLFYYVTRATPSWEMTSFFVLHGVCVAVEVAFKRVAGDTWRLPRTVAVLLTVGFVVGTSFWLFFPPLIRTGADVKVLEEFRSCLEFLKTKLSLATNN